MYHCRWQRTSLPLRLTYPLLQRYLLAEGSALVGASLGITLASRFSSNEFWLVGVSVGSGSLAYYAMLIGYALRSSGQHLAQGSLPMRMPIVADTLLRLLMSFGSAELVDSLLVSPMLLYLCLQSMPSHQLAVLVSELLSTVLFYVIVIATKATRTEWNEDL